MTGLLTRMEQNRKDREILPLARRSSLLFAHRGAESIVRGGMETAGRTVHPDRGGSARAAAITGPSDSLQ
jgi:hypothetical protein